MINRKLGVDKKFFYFITILGVKKNESKKNFCSVLSFVLSELCTKRLKMCKNWLYFATKCPFRSQNSLIIKHLHTIHPASPFLRSWRTTPLTFKIFIFFILLFGSVFVSKKYHILCVFYMVLDIKIGCFCGIKN